MILLVIDDVIQVLKGRLQDIYIAAPGFYQGVISPKSAITQVNPVPKGIHREIKGMVQNLDIHHN
jgi:hypothetical protein